MAAPLDDIDRRILVELSRDGRMSMRTLAELLHISRANAYARVQRLRDTDVIRGFRADVDHVAAGMGTWGFKGSPVFGVTMAELIAAGRTSNLIAPFTPSRFREDRMVPDAASAGTH